MKFFWWTFFLRVSSWKFPKKFLWKGCPWSPDSDTTFTSLIQISKTIINIQNNSVWKWEKIFSALIKSITLKVLVLRKISLWLACNSFDQMNFWRNLPIFPELLWLTKPTNSKIDWLSFAWFTWRYYQSFLHLPRKMLAFICLMQDLNSVRKFLVITLLFKQFPEVLESMLLHNYMFSS